MTKNKETNKRNWKRDTKKVIKRKSVWQTEW